MVENSKLIIDYKSGFGICVKENQLGKCNYYNRRWLLKDFVSDILAIGAVMSKKLNERSKFQLGTAFLKCHVNIQTEDGSEVSLSLPECRQTRESVRQIYQPKE